MDNKELLNDFISRLTLNYKDNAAISELIKGLKSIEHFDSISSENNIIKCVYNNGDNEVLFDENAKRIVFKDKGETVYNGKKISVSIENTYIEDVNGFHIDTLKTTEEEKVEKTDNGLYIVKDTSIENSYFENTIKIIEDKKIKSIDGYKDDRHVFSSVSTNYKKYKANRDNLLLLDSNSDKKDVYLLTNGDTLKIVNNNGVEEYYYCDSSEMYPEDKKDDTKVKFNSKINYVDLVKILENPNNAIDIANIDDLDINNKIR